jgi:hypothetical protein
MDIDIKVQWHAPDNLFAAVLVRDGEPWFLEGMLVGQDATPGAAVADLLDQAGYLVEHGHNFMGGIADGDRAWLGRLLDQGNDWAGMERRYAALRQAGIQLPLRG